MLCIHPICFSEDFAALMPKLLAKKALTAPSSFCAHLGIRLKDGKSDVGSAVALLGLLGRFPCNGHSYTLKISLPEEKRAGWAALLADFIRKRSITHEEMGTLIDRLSFPQILLFWEFAKTNIMPMYLKMRRLVYNARLADAALSAFSFRGRVARPIPPRVCRPCSHFSERAIYTVATTSPAHICAHRFSGATERPRIAQQLSAAVPTEWAYLCRSTCLISGMELMALVPNLADSPAGIAGCSVWFYMDSNNYLSATTKAGSGEAFISAPVSRACELIMRFQIRDWFTWGTYKLNPSDLPTRSRKVPFRAGRQVSFRPLTHLYALCRKATESKHILPVGDIANGAPPPPSRTKKERAIVTYDSACSSVDAKLRGAASSEETFPGGKFPLHLFLGEAYTFIHFSCRFHYSLVCDVTTKRAGGNFWDGGKSAAP